MAEHRIKKNNVIYIIPNDELFEKWKADDAYIDDYGRLVNRKPHRVIKELRHYADDRPINVVSQPNNPVKTAKQDSPLMDYCKEKAMDACEYYLDKGLDWFFYEGLPNIWHKHVVPLYHQAKDALTTKEIKAEKVLRETPKKETSIVNSATKKKAMTAEEAELEKKKVLYHWFEMLVSLKKLHDAEEMDYDSVLAKLTDESMLKRVNAMLEENPNLLETEKYITLHDLLGRDLYKDKQLIPIKGEEIVTLAEKHNQNSAQM